MEKQRQNLVMVLDNIRSRENVGSIFRTADAGGVSKLYLCGITPHPPHNKISKASLGAENFIEWEYCRQTWRALDLLKKEGFFIVALEQTRSSKDLFKYKFLKTKKIAIILGNEIRGLNRRTLKTADAVLRIPMFGKKESLNVSVSAGIAVYQVKMGR